MKEIKLSFPYPSTSRHNLSQDIATSLSMGLVTPVRVIQVLPGDSHRIGTSFSLISNPLVKPLLQGVNMRYCRFWVPSRIYSIDQRANNQGFDPMKREVRASWFQHLNFPANSNDESMSNFQASSLFDYLQLAPLESNFILRDKTPDALSFPLSISDSSGLLTLNLEPYIGYIDICRNYFADSANNMIAWCSLAAFKDEPNRLLDKRLVCVSPLNQLDAYIDQVQNGRGYVDPYNWVSTSYDTVTPAKQSFSPFCLTPEMANSNIEPFKFNDVRFSPKTFGLSHVGLCVPLNRPDRLSRLFDLKPLTSQNASIPASEVTIANLSFLEKIQRYLTRRFFGGSRYTDVMYSVFGQKVPHVDSPVLLDVFDYELGSELVASTNATESQNPGVLGGFFSASGVLTSGRGRAKKRYTFNENGYLIDVVYILPRLFRASFLPDFYPLAGGTSYGGPMAQGNFIPDFNGIGWQQPAFVKYFCRFSVNSLGFSFGAATPFACEPSWQQMRTLPDVCTGLLNPTRSAPIGTNNFLSTIGNVENVNTPFFTFSDRMNGYNFYYAVPDKPGEIPLIQTSPLLLASKLFSDFNDLNRVFGVESLDYDNIFVVFRYAHQAKRQVTKRFTLSF